MNTEKIKKIIEEILRRMPVSFNEIEFFDETAEGGALRFLIKTNEPELLIGRDGMTLLAIYHIVRRMAEQAQDGVEVNFIVDVNNFQKNKLNELKQKAKMMAERARFFKSSVELEPMSSYERMIVHSFLEPFPDLTTESIGVGPARHVVIKYQEIAD